MKNFIVIIFIILAIIIAYLYIFTNRKIDHFDSNIKVQNTNIIYTSNKYNINWTNGNFIDINSNIKNSSDIINIKKLNYTSNCSIIVDNYDYNYYLNDLNILSKSPNAYFVSLMSDYTYNKLDSPYNLNGKTIGYYDRSDYIFIQALIRSYRLDLSTIKLYKLTINELANLNKIINYVVDIIITAIIPKSSYNILIASQNLVIKGFDILDINRLKLFYPTLNITYYDNNSTSTDKREGNRNTSGINLIDLFGTLTNFNLIIPEKETITNLPYTNFIELQLKLNTSSNIAIPNVIVYNSVTENFITNITLPDDSINGKYKCVGNNINKWECESKFDVIGNPKIKETSWVKSCVTDDDCPFFQANMNYQNNRGGCLSDGSCELPIGVKRNFYVDYNDSSIYAPFCYGCISSNNINLNGNCCSQQKTRLYSNLLSPDYAFADDYNDRKSSNLVTIISPL